jgi:PAS domain S-box-containing protein
VRGALGDGDRVLLRVSDGAVLDVNDSFVRLTGFKPDELRGRSPVELKIISTSGGDGEVLTALRGDRPVSVLEVQVQTRSGEVRQAILRTELLETASRPMVAGVSNWGRVLFFSSVTQKMTSKRMAVATNSARRS